jgi:hypothetical protein
VAEREAKSTAALEHLRLADADEAVQMKSFWRKHLSALKSRLEGGEIDADVNVVAVLCCGRRVRPELGVLRGPRRAASR